MHFLVVRAILELANKFLNEFIVDSINFGVQNLCNLCGDFNDLRCEFGVLDQRRSGCDKGFAACEGVVLFHDVARYESGLNFWLSANLVCELQALML
jgi:hypothetical protein